MKKLAVKITLMIVVMIGVSNYMMYIMTGKSPMTFSMSNFSLSGATDAIKSVGNDVIPAKTETAYKWTDEHGVVHYSNEAPPEAIGSEKLTVNPNTNLVQGVTPKPDAPNLNESPNQPTMPTGNIYDPNTIKKLMDDTKDVQNKLNKRTEDLEQY